MRSYRRMAFVVCIGLLTLLSLFQGNTIAAGPIDEFEPNNDCSTPQRLGVVDGNLTVNGSLDGLSSAYPDPDETPNVDVFNVQITEDAFWKVTVAGAASGAGTLERPQVVIYYGNSSGSPYDCYAYQTYNPTGTESSDLVFYWQAVAISELTFGITSCCDGSLPLGGSAGGSYTLTIEETAPVGPITGRLIDAATGAPPVLDPFFPTFVELYRCEQGDCAYLRGGNLDEFGRFEFRSDYSWEPLIEGTYAVLISSPGFQPLVTPHFTLGPGEGRDLGDLPLTASQLISSISGQLVNARTGTPVSGAVSLDFCNGISCFEQKLITADETGRFEFISTPDFSQLFTGLYRIRIDRSGYHPYTGAIFAVTQLDTDVGTIALDPLPQIGSVSGQLVNAVNGAPLAGQEAPFASVMLIRCVDGACWESLASTSTDAEGRFQFIANESGYLPPGEYIIQVYAEQYNAVSTEPFMVAEDEDYTLGPVALQSIPLRMENPFGCGDIQASGGVCRFGVDVANGTADRSVYQIWSVVTVYGPGTSLRTNAFQPQEAQRIVLRRGAETTVRFRLQVPASVPANTVICASVFAAEDQRGFYFYSANQRFIFCGTKQADGTIRIMPESEGRATQNRLQGIPAGPPTRR